MFSLNYLFLCAEFAYLILYYILLGIRVFHIPNEGDVRTMYVLYIAMVKPNRSISCNNFVWIGHFFFFLIVWRYSLFLFRFSLNVRQLCETNQRNNMKWTLLLFLPSPSSTIILAVQTELLIAAKRPFLYNAYDSFIHSFILLLPYKFAYSKECISKYIYH